MRGGLEVGGSVPIASTNIKINDGDTFHSFYFGVLMYKYSI